MAASYQPEESVSRCELRTRMSALEDAQLLPQCQVLGEEPSTGTKAAQHQTQPEAEHGQWSY